MAATIALLIGGAILNSTAFVGGSYLAKYLSSDGKHFDEEKIRHDKAIELYQKNMGEYHKKKQEYEEWLEIQYKNKQIADSNLSDTDYAFRIYSKTHPDFNLKEPQLGDYYKPNKKQKQYEMMYVGGGMLGAGYLASKFI